MYYCYLNGDIKGAEEFQELINKCSDAILKTCPIMIRDERSIKKERKELKEIIDKTKNLIKTIQPPV